MPVLFNLTKKLIFHEATFIITIKAVKEIFNPSGGNGDNMVGHRVDT